MDGIPKGRQGDSSDEENDDERIPLAIRIKQRRLANEANGGKPIKKHHDPAAEDKENDEQSDKQKAAASVKKGDNYGSTKPSGAKPAASEADKKATAEGEGGKEGEEKPKEGEKGFVPPELAGITGAIGVRQQFFPSENSNGMPIHLNDNDYGDNLFGSHTKFDAMAFKTSAERSNGGVGSDGLTFDVEHSDFNGRSVSAPEPTMEQESFGSENWHDMLDK